MHGSTTYIGVLQIRHILLPENFCPGDPLLLSKTFLRPAPLSLPISVHVYEPPANQQEKL